MLSGATYGIQIMGRATKTMIATVLVICVMCIVVGIRDFRWLGVDLSFAGDPILPYWRSFSSGKR